MGVVDIMVRRALCTRAKNKAKKFDDSIGMGTGEREREKVIRENYGGGC